LLRAEDGIRARNVTGVQTCALPISAAVRPEQGLLGLRKALALFANLRPVVASETLIDASPLKADRVRGTDLMIVRELTGGLYFEIGRASCRRTGWTRDRGGVIRSRQ